MHDGAAAAVAARGVSAHVLHHTGGLAMRRSERSITSFRRRLKRLIAEKFDGRYTRLARRAGVPVSTLEHTLLEAKRLPGGDHLLRLARALDVTAHFLVTGEDAARPAGGPSRLLPGLPPGAAAPSQAYLTIPVLACACPATCPLTAAVPRGVTSHTQVVLERELLGTGPYASLVAVEVTAECPAAEWRTGTRLVVAWGRRPRRWGALALVHAQGHCEWGYVKQVEDALFCAEEVDGEFRVIPAGAWRILGTAIAAVAPL
jgi:hypothetical protein